MPRSVIRTLVLIVGLTAGATGCARDAGLTPEQEEVVRSEGAAATQALMRALQAHLMAAMQEGPAVAVRVCAEKALPVTDSVASSLGEGFQIKRVSAKHRNPVNAPDEAEAAALRHFADALAETGSLPESWVQETAAGEYRFYRAVTLAPPCLGCHGDPASFDPDVKDALAEAYPEDLATGYQAGDFRGLVRVTVPASKVQG